METKTKKNRPVNKSGSNQEQKKIVNELKNESFGNWKELDIKRQMSINELKKESFGNWLED
jgi:cytochrome c551/c552